MAMHVHEELEICHDCACWCANADDSGARPGWKWRAKWPDASVSVGDLLEEQPEEFKCDGCKRPAFSARWNAVVLRPGTEHECEECCRA